MVKSNLVGRVMGKIARLEEKRLTHTLGVTIVVLSFLGGIVFFALFKTVTALIEAGIVDLFSTIELDWEILRFSLTDISLLVIDETEKGTLVLIVLALVVIGFIIRRTKFFSFSSRFKEIAKYC